MMAAHNEGAIIVSKWVGMTSTATGAAAYADTQLTWLGLLAPEITAVAGLVSILGVFGGLIMSFYFNHKRLEVMRIESNKNSVSNEYES